MAIAAMAMNKEAVVDSSGGCRGKSGPTRQIALDSSGVAPTHEGASSPTQSNLVSCPVNGSPHHRLCRCLRVGVLRPAVA